LKPLARGAFIATRLARRCNCAVRFFLPEARREPDATHSRRESADGASQTKGNSFSQFAREFAGQCLYDLGNLFIHLFATERALVGTVGQ